MENSKIMNILHHQFNNMIYNIIIINNNKVVQFYMKNKIKILNLN
jgi:hypothetical protein